MESFNVRYKTQVIVVIVDFNFISRLISSLSKIKASENTGDHEPQLRIGEHFIWDRIKVGLQCY